MSELRTKVAKLLMMRAFGRASDMRAKMIHLLSKHRIVREIVDHKNKCFLNDHGVAFPSLHFRKLCTPSFEILSNFFQSGILLQKVD